MRDSIVKLIIQQSPSDMFKAYGTGFIVGTAYPQLDTTKPPDSSFIMTNYHVLQHVIRVRKRLYGGAFDSKCWIMTSKYVRYCCASIQ